MNGSAIVALTIGIVLIGYVVVVRPLEARIAERYALVAAARGTIDGEPALRQRIDAAQLEQRRLRTALARYALDAGPAATLRRFLEAVSAAAVRHGTTIRSLDAEPSPMQGTASPQVLDELALRLTLRGSYPDVLATLRELVTAPIASRIAIEALTPDDRQRVRPALVAAVRVVLLRLPEGHRVRPEPR